MFDKDFSRHFNEVAYNLRNHRYERTDDGRVYFPAMHAYASGMYIHNVNGEDERCDPNLIPDEGLTYLAGVALTSVSQITTWYLSLYGTAYTPLSTLTAASYPATAGEITSGTEGYSESVRQTWVGVAGAAGVNTNTASPAAFTIVTASSLAVNGAALTSVSTKGGTTGTLFSAAQFGTTRTLYDTDVFNLTYQHTLTSS